MIEKKRSRFTEEDQELVEYLPKEEREDFNSKLAQLMMRKQINDDRWNEELDRIHEDADALFTKIKARLETLRGEVAPDA